MGKARAGSDINDFLKNLTIKQIEQYGHLRNQYQGTPFDRGASQGSAKVADESRYKLDKRGGIMFGSIGFKAVSSTNLAASGIINLNDYNVPRLVIPNAGGNTLKVLIPVLNDGQMIWIRAQVTQTVTIQHTAGGGDETTGNIHLLGAANYTLGSDDWIGFIYDKQTNKWFQYTVGKNNIGGGSGANTALSNLITTSINQSLLPSATNLRDLGSSSLNWKDAYMRKIFLGASPLASTGTLNLPNAQYIRWRNSENTGDFGIRLNTNEQFQFEGSLVPNVDNTNDLGDQISALRWRDLNLTRNFSAMGHATITGALNVGGHFHPLTDNTSDLGAAAYEFRDLYIDGTAKIDTLQVDVIASFSGTSCAIHTSLIQLGDSNSDDLYILARVKSDVEPDADATYDLGSSSLVWNFFYGANIAIPEKYAAGSEPTGKANTAILFTRDNGAGKTQLRVKFNTGTSVLLATEP